MNGIPESDIYIPGACAEASPVSGHAPSLLPADRDFSLVWNDEFDGDRLDETKWSYRTNFWGRRAHWFATPEDGAVEVKDGCCHLRLVRRPDGYTFFVDGAQHGPKVGGGPGEAVSQVEEFILISTETQYYRQNHMTGKGAPGLAAAAEADDAFLVDFVRVFDFTPLPKKL